MSKAFLTICLMFLTFTLGHAATYYVATTGNNSNSCSTSQTIGTPKQTIASGLACMSAGDTLYLRGGTYTGGISTQSMTVPTGTSWGNAPFIGAYQSETVVFPTGGIVLHGASTQYIIFDRLILDGSRMLIYDSAHHIRVQNGEVKNNPCGACQGIAAGNGAHHLEFINLKVHHNGTNRLEHGWYMAAPDSLIENSDIYSNSGMGIQIYSSGFVDRADNTIIRNNRIHDNLGDAGVTLNHGNNILFYNNLVYSNPNGVMVSYGSANNTRIYNNVIHNHPGAGIIIDSGIVNTLIKNNIIQNNGTGVSLASGSTGTVFDTNISYNNSTPYVNNGTNTTIANVLTGNPLFVNSGSADYHLQTGSAGINTCIDLSGTFTTDFDNATRTDTWECGAYIYGATTPVNLVFFTPPSSAVVNVLMVPPVTVCAQVSGVTQTSFPNNIALALTTGTGALTGGGAAAPTNGCRSFSISIDAAGTDKVITASATNATSIASGAFVINAAASVAIKTDRILRVP